MLTMDEQQVDYVRAKTWFCDLYEGRYVVVVHEIEKTVPYVSKPSGGWWSWLGFST